MDFSAMMENVAQLVRFQKHDLGRGVGRIAGDRYARQAVVVLRRGV